LPALGIVWASIGCNMVHHRQLANTVALSLCILPLLVVGSAVPPPLQDTVMEEYFDNVTHGPGLWKWRHYFSVYEHHLKRFRGTDVVIAKVGIYSGGGLKMWRNYLGPHAHIIGVDISERVMAYKDNPRYGRPDQIFVGDQNSSEFWTRFKQSVPRLDVLIDDGGHLPELQISTLKAIFDHLAPGGVYICEDIIVPAYGSEFLRFTIDHFVMDPGGISGKPSQKWGSGKKRKNYQRTFMETSAQQRVAQVALYPYMLVIEKLLHARTELQSVRHGTLWQPPAFWSDHGQSGGGRRLLPSRRRLGAE